MKFLNEMTIKSLAAFVPCMGIFLALASPIAHAQDDFANNSTSKRCLGNEEMNFGVLVHNPYYQIYRSSGLGTRGLEDLKSYFKEVGLELPQKIIYMNLYGYNQTPDNSFGSLKTLTSESFQRLMLATRSAVTHREIYYSGSFAYDEKIAAQNSGTSKEIFPFSFIHGGNRDVFLTGQNPLSEDLNAKLFSDDDGNIVKRKGGRSSVYRILEEILVHDKPLLFHCKGGIHRTGMVGLMIRYLQGGIWTDVHPPVEFSEVPVSSFFGTKNLSLRNLAEFEYSQHNPSRVRPNNFKAMHALSQEPRFKCLHKNFAYYLNATDEISTACYPSQPAPGSLRRKFNPQALWDKCAAL
jgi:hypothetical protein